MKTKQKATRAREWHKRLTVAELRHVAEHCGGTLTGLRQAIEHQATHGIRCWDCRTAARKLNLLAD